MLKNKIFITFLLIFTTVLKGIALNSNYKSFLNQIEIKKETANRYSINLLFESGYEEPLNIVEKDKNIYTIILPETKKMYKNFNTINTNNEKIQIQVEEHPYIDKTINNGYVKILIKTTGNIKLKANAINKLALPKKQTEKTQITPAANTKKAIEATQEIAKTNPQEQTQEIIKSKESPTSVQNNPKANIGEITPDNAIIPKEITKVQPTELKRSLPKFNLFETVLKTSLLLAIILITFGKVKELVKEMSEKETIPLSNKKFSSTATAKPKFKTEFDKLKEKENKLNNIFSLDDEMRSKIKLIKDAANTPSDKQVTVEIKMSVEEKNINNSPTLISNTKIDTNKGFYLVDYEGETALIGYIGDEIFIINKFKKLNNCNLRMRLNEKNTNKSTYIVKLDNYKALIEVCEDKMNLVVEL